MKPKRDPDEYTERQYRYMARTRNIQSHRPENDLTETREIPLVPPTQPARDWSPEALNRLLQDLRTKG
jgi:hypothetical protein